MLDITDAAGGCASVVSQFAAQVLTDVDSYGSPFLRLLSIANVSWAIFLARMKWGVPNRVKTTTTMTDQVSKDIRTPP
ncbi:hypothetical protein SOM22_17135 [Stenotrophomonas rhizophila]|uniref:hypothetical protein n=1 Tax=Stenotrophomonas TaxID=40323 RepID=UPI0011AEEB54|nr:MULTISPECIES: hypothetical protein [Stenotrophomonas]MCW6027117.1 hypothetical protein [Stenotrophomonas sp. SRS1]MDY0956304.1 hypothetical protein [Stenotrophomonas rhizophila]